MTEPGVPVPQPAAQKADVQVSPSPLTPEAAATGGAAASSPRPVRDEFMPILSGVGQQQSPLGPVAQRLARWQLPRLVVSALVAYAGGTAVWMLFVDPLLALIYGVVSVTVWNFVPTRIDRKLRRSDLDTLVRLQAEGQLYQGGGASSFLSSVKLLVLLVLTLLLLKPHQPLPLPEPLWVVIGAVLAASGKVFLTMNTALQAALVRTARPQNAEIPSQEG